MTVLDARAWKQRAAGRSRRSESAATCCGGCAGRDHPGALDRARQQVPRWQATLSGWDQVDLLARTLLGFPPALGDARALLGSRAHLAVNLAGWRWRCRWPWRTLCGQHQLIGPPGGESACSPPRASRAGGSRLGVSHGRQSAAPAAGRLPAVTAPISGRDEAPALP
jgi:hypothetical protein